MRVAFDIPSPIARSISKRAGELGVTPSAFIAGRLKGWLETEDNVSAYLDAVDLMKKALNEYEASAAKEPAGG